jgi:hypothetical protein
MSVVTDYIQNTKVLNTTIASLKAKIGVFLQNQSLILNAQTFANSVKNNTTGPVQASAMVLVAKGDALLSVQNTIEQSAQEAIFAASALKTKVDSPEYGFLKGNPLQWGTIMYQRIGVLLKDTSALAARANGLAGQIDKQNKAVKGYIAEVKQIEKAAAGTGIIPKISNVIAGTLGVTASSLSKLVWPIAIAAGAGLALFAFIKTRK